MVIMAMERSETPTLAYWISGWTTHQAESRLESSPPDMKRWTLNGITSRLKLKSATHKLQHKHLLVGYIIVTSSPPGGTLLEKKFESSKSDK